MQRICTPSARISIRLSTRSRRRTDAQCSMNDILRELPIGQERYSYPMIIKTASCAVDVPAEAGITTVAVWIDTVRTP